MRDYSTIKVEYDGENYVAEWHSDGQRWYVSGPEGNVMFSIKGYIAPPTVAQYIEVYLDGHTNGFGKGVIFGADQCREQFHKVLGVDKLVAKMEEIADTIRDLPGRR